MYIYTFHTKALNVTPSVKLFKNFTLYLSTTLINLIYLYSLIIHFSYHVLEGSRRSYFHSHDQ